MRPPHSDSHPVRDRHGLLSLEIKILFVQPIVPHCTSDEKCSNDGKCEITDDESFCKCSKDYFGPFCEMKSCSG